MTDLWDDGGGTDLWGDGGGTDLWYDGGGSTDLWDDGGGTDLWDDGGDTDLWDDGGDTDLWDDGDDTDLWVMVVIQTCGMMVSLDLRSWSPMLLMLTSSMWMLPPAASMMRNNANATLDLPAPVRPTIPTYNTNTRTESTCVQAQKLLIYMEPKSQGSLGLAEKQRMTRCAEDRPLFNTFERTEFAMIQKKSYFSLNNYLSKFKHNNAQKI